MNKKALKSVLIVVLCAALVKIVFAKTDTQVVFLPFTQINNSVLPDTAVKIDTANINSITSDTVIANNIKTDSVKTDTTKTVGGSRNHGAYRFALG